MGTDEVPITGELNQLFSYMVGNAEMSGVCDPQDTPGEAYKKLQQQYDEREFWRASGKISLGIDALEKRWLELPGWIVPYVQKLIRFKKMLSEEATHCGTSVKFWRKNRNDLIEWGNEALKLLKNDGQFLMNPVEKEPDSYLWQRGGAINFDFPLVVKIGSKGVLDNPFLITNIPKSRSEINSPIGLFRLPKHSEREESKEILDRIQHRLLSSYFTPHFNTSRIEMWIFDCQEFAIPQPEHIAWLRKVSQLDDQRLAIDEVMEQYRTMPFPILWRSKSLGGIVETVAKGFVDKCLWYISTQISSRMHLLSSWVDVVDVNDLDALAYGKILALKDDWYNYERVLTQNVEAAYQVIEYLPSWILEELDFAKKLVIDKHPEIQTMGGVAKYWKKHQKLIIEHASKIHSLIEYAGEIPIDPLEKKIKKHLAMKCMI